MMSNRKHYEHFKGAWRVWSLAIVLIVLSLVSAAPEREIAQPDPEPRVLLFTDNAAGSKLVAETWIAVLSDQKEPLETATDVNAFIARLMSDHWSSVHIIAQAQAGDPPWGKAVRDFLQRNVKKNAFLHLWKLPDDAAEPAAPFLATTAMAVWSANPDRSIIGYTITKNQEPKVSKAKVHPGVVFPDFEGIVLAEPFLLGADVVGPKEAAPPAKPKEAARRNSPLTGCKRDCANAYRDRLLALRKDFDEYQNGCFELYGPAPIGAGKPDELLRCIAEAIMDVENDTTAAARRAYLCMAVCEKRQKEEDEQPPVEVKPQ